MADHAVHPLATQIHAYLGSHATGQLAASPRTGLDPDDLDALRTFGWHTTAETIAGSPSRPRRDRAATIVE